MRKFLALLACSLRSLVAQEPATNAVPARVEPAVAPLPVASAPASPGKAYVIPVKGPIDHTRLYILKRGLQEAREQGANAVVLDMDTLGGALLITDEMTKLLMDQSLPTYTFVEKDAISAGAIIAMSTDRIYMKRGSRIGDAMPVMMSSSGGGYESLGEAEREKITSPTDAMVRLITERKGRDTLLARCMVRRELEYKIGDTVICPKGEILTMTNMEAERKFGDPPKPLLSEGTVEDIPAMLARDGKQGWTVLRQEEAPAESLANLISTLAPLIIGLASLLFYLEMNTPGFGWPGITAIALFALFFFGQHAAGLAGNEEIGLFALGILLIVVEIFFIPGFGLIGLGGLALVVGSLLAAMIKTFPDALPEMPGQEFSVFDRMYGIRHALRSVSLGIVGAGAGVLVLGRFLPESTFGRRMVLQTRLAGGPVEARDEVSPLLGRVGEALTALRPAGQVRIAERLVDVVSSGGYIEKGTRVTVVEARGNRVVVEKTPGDGAAA